MAITIKKYKGGANQEPLQQAHQKAPKTLPHSHLNTAQFENSNFKNKKRIKMQEQYVVILLIFKSEEV